MNLALFDFDGTITHADTFVPFIHFSTRKARVRLGSALLSPLVVGHKLNMVPAKHVRVGAILVAFAGRAEAEVLEWGRRYAETLDRVVRPNALERLRFHQAQGDTVVVVSASLNPYLRPWCARVGVELICSELESRGGILTGRHASGDCSGETKARRVRERYVLDRFERVYAYGDTLEDVELLSLAHHPYFCWQELRDVAARTVSATAASIIRLRAAGA